MQNFQITVTDGRLDLDRIARSGQMFRWLPNGDGWAIYDGDHVHLVEQVDEVLHVRSNQDHKVFKGLMRFDEDHGRKLEDIVRLGPELEPSLKNLVGMRMMRPVCARETLFSFLCSANNHLSRITSMVWKLSEARNLPSTPSLASIPFLTINQIASIGEGILRQEGFGYRGKSIPQVAKRLESDGGDRLLEELKSEEYGVARDYLLTLPGVGPKLADCICLFAFDHQEAVPVDTHIWQQLTKIYYPNWHGTALTKTKYDYATKAFRDRFGALAGVAHQFLFVDNMTSYRNKNPKS
ncbi:MAG: hypothetical protein WCK51_06795 [Armatimonadota bacterium]